MSQALVNQAQNSLPSTPNSPELRRDLLRWVDRITDRRYPRTPTKHGILGGHSEEAVRAQMLVLREEQAPPSQQEWASHYAMLVLNFPQQAMTEMQAKLKFQTFCSDLAGIPAACVARACERYRLEPSKDGKPKFFPQNWQIMAMCEEYLKEAKSILRALDEMENVLRVPALTQQEPEYISADRAREIRERLERMAAEKRGVHLPERVG